MVSIPSPGHRIGSGKNPFPIGHTNGALGIIQGAMLLRLLGGGGMSWYVYDCVSKNGENTWSSSVKLLKTPPIALIALWNNLWMGSSFWDIDNFTSDNSSPLLTALCFGIHRRWFLGCVNKPKNIQKSCEVTCCWVMMDQWRVWNLIPSLKLTNCPPKRKGLFPNHHNFPGRNC